MPKNSYEDNLPDNSELLSFRIEKKIGAGGFGVTYKAWDKNLDREVAIKEHYVRELSVRRDGRVIARSTSDTVDFNYALDRFWKEAKTLAQMDHPLLPTVYTAFKLNGTAYIVMEFEKGTDLARFIKNQKRNNNRLSEDFVTKLLLDLFTAVEHIHQKKYLHRDLKPANLMIRPDNSPAIIDFGTARHEVAENTRVTNARSPNFSPPELFSVGRAEGQGMWTDVYSLGATFYELLTWQRPADASDRMSSETDHKRASELAEGLYSKRLLRSIDIALDMDRKKRFKDIQAWRKYLARGLWPKRIRNAILVSALLAVVIGIHFPGFFSVTGDGGPQPKPQTKNTVQIPASSDDAKNEEPIEGTIDAGFLPEDLANQDDIAEPGTTRLVDHALDEEIFVIKRELSGTLGLIEDYRARNLDTEDLERRREELQARLKAIE